MKSSEHLQYPNYLIPNDFKKLTLKTIAKDKVILYGSRYNSNS